MSSFCGDKRGQLVAGLAFFLIVIILAGFSAVGILSSKAEKSQGGVFVFDEDDLEIGDLYGYVEDYVEGVEVWNDVVVGWGWEYYV